MKTAKTMSDAELKLKVEALARYAASKRCAGLPEQHQREFIDAHWRDYIADACDALAILQVIDERDASSTN